MVQMDRLKLNYILMKNLILIQFAIKSSAITLYAQFHVITATKKNTIWLTKKHCTHSERNKKVAWPEVLYMVWQETW